MNSRSQWKRLSMVAVIGLFVGSVLSGMRDVSVGMTREARAQGSDPAEASHWEYKTSSTDSVSLQTHLTSIGCDGWDVFSVTTTDAIVDTGPDGKPHLTTQRFEVTAKRKVRR